MMKIINIKIKYIVFTSILFILILLSGSIKINAYYNKTDTIYSSTLKFDKNDYYDVNIFYFKDSNYNQTKFYHLTLNTSNNQLQFTCEGGFCYGNVFITNQLEINKQYTMIFNTHTTDNTKNNRIGLSYQSNNVDILEYGEIRANYNNKRNITFTAQSNNLYLIAYLTSSEFTNNFTTTLSNIMIVEGNNVPDNYSEKFQFGYKITNNYTANTFSYTLIDNYDNTKTYTLKNNSSVYVPFQYLNNVVTFSYNINQNTSANITSLIDLKFTPIFTGTLKSNNTNVLKSNYTYVYNYLYYRNFKLSNLQDINLDDMLQIEFISNSYDSKSLNINNVTETNNIISNYTSDVKQTDIINKDIYFNGNDSLYSFNIKTYMYTAQNGLIYSINFDSIGLGVLNSMSSNSFETNSTDNLEYYPVCGSLFDDFGCNVNNAVTFVVFNIPLLGPVIGFIRDMYTIFSNLITALEWYEGLGILFSVFIVIMFLKILSILWKGKDE